MCFLFALFVLYLGRVALRYNLPYRRVCMLGPNVQLRVSPKPPAEITGAGGFSQYTSWGGHIKRQEVIIVHPYVRSMGDPMGVGLIMVFPTGQKG